MRKALNIFSVANCCLAVFALLVQMSPGIVGFIDSIGFGVIFTNIFLPVISALLWTIYTFIRETTNDRLKIITVAAIIIHSILFINVFAGFITFGDGLFIAILPPLLSLIFNILFVFCSKQKEVQ